MGPLILKKAGTAKVVRRRTRASTKRSQGTKEINMGGGDIDVHQNKKTADKTISHSDSLTVTEVYKTKLAEAITNPSTERILPEEPENKNESDIQSTNSSARKYKL